MLFLKNIRPQHGYCLFFPNRKSGQRFESGRKVRVWFWEEWLHIKLGQFEIRLPEERPNLHGNEQQPSELATTSENLKCRYEAKFQIVIGGEQKGREDRISKATISCVPGRKIMPGIEHDFFRSWAKNYCNTSIAVVIRQCQYMRLLEDTEYRAQAAKAIEAHLEETLGNIGLILIRADISLEPAEPEEVTAPPDIVKGWLEFKRTREEAETEKRALQYSTAQTRATKDAEHNKIMAQISAVSEKEIVLISKQYENETDIEIERKKNEKDKDITIINKEMNARAQEAQKEHIAYEENLERMRDQEHAQTEKSKQTYLHDAEIKEQLDSAELARKEQESTAEIDRLKDESEKERVGHELELQKMRLKKLEEEKKVMDCKAELSVVKQQIENANIVQEQKRREMEAKYLKEKTLAKAADVISLRKTVTDILPEIVKEANRPIEKIGEMKVNILSGMDGTHGSSNVIGNILTGVSLLPTIKQCLEFLKDFDDASVLNRDSNEDTSIHENTIDSKSGRIEDISTEYSKHDSVNEYSANSSDDDLGVSNIENEEIEELFSEDVEIVDEEDDDIAEK